MDKDVVMEDVKTAHLWIFVCILGASQRERMKTHIFISRSQRYHGKQSTSRLTQQTREMRSKDGLDHVMGKAYIPGYMGVHMCVWEWRALQA